MSEQFNHPSLEDNSNVLNFPIEYKKPHLTIDDSPSLLTPTFNKLVKDAKRLDLLSKYPCTFDYTVYRDLELRYKDRPISASGGVKRGHY